MISVSVQLHNDQCKGTLVERLVVLTLYDCDWGTQLNPMRKVSALTGDVPNETFSTIRWLFSDGVDGTVL